MDATRNQFRTQAFVLTGSELGKVYALFPTDSNITIEINCKDGIERKYKSLEEFLNFEHPPAKQISKLILRSYSAGFKNSTSLYFQNNEPPSHNLSSLSEGEEAYVVEISDKLEDRFSAMKPWYDWVARYGWIAFIGIWTIGWALLYGRKLVGSQYTVSSLFSDIRTSSIGNVSTFLLLLVTSTLLGNWIFNRIRNFINYAFPIGVFAFGQGVQRHQNRDKLRTVFIIGFVLNVIAGFVVWILTR